MLPHRGVAGLLALETQPRRLLSDLRTSTSERPALGLPHSMLPRPLSKARLDEQGLQGRVASPLPSRGPRPPIGRVPRGVDCPTGKRSGGTFTGSMARDILARAPGIRNAPQIGRAHV